MYKRTNYPSDKDIQIQYKRVMTLVEGGRGKVRFREPNVSTIYQHGTGYT